MQFREQGRKIQCLRSVYSPEDKRCHQKLVASFDRHIIEAPKAAVAALTEAEQQALATWLAARKARYAASTSHFHVRHGGKTLAELVEAIRLVSDPPAEEAAAIWKGLAEVAKALRMVGRPKPKPNARKGTAKTRRNRKKVRG